ncbi:hypothetical protein FQZ97_1018130 [compost metagenome]
MEAAAPSALIAALAGRIGLAVAFTGACDGVDRTGSICIAAPAGWPAVPGVAVCACSGQAATAATTPMPQEAHGLPFMNVFRCITHPLSGPEEPKNYL